MGLAGAPGAHTRFYNGTGQPEGVNPSLTFPTQQLCTHECSPAVGMPQSEFHLKAAQEGNLVRNNSESCPQSLRWVRSPRLRNPAHGWGWRGHGGAGRCSVGLGTPVAAQGHSL